MRPSLVPWIPAAVFAVALVAPAAAQDDPTRAARESLVLLIQQSGVRDAATLAAMRAVPRHQFVPAEYRDVAYADTPLPIGLGQTISQPYIVAFMTEALRLAPLMRVLEVGTGSGYQAAVLDQVGCRVFTLEIFSELAERARERLERLGYRRTTVRHGDGHFGWAEHAPFDAIIVTAAAGYIPPALVEQLKPGGRMIIPVGSVQGVQFLVLVEKRAGGRVTTQSLLPVRFVPMLQGVR